MSRLVKLVIACAALLMLVLIGLAVVSRLDGLAWRRERDAVTARGDTLLRRLAASDTLNARSAVQATKDSLELTRLRTENGKIDAARGVIARENSRLKTVLALLPADAPDSQRINVLEQIIAGQDQQIANLTQRVASADAATTTADRMAAEFRLSKDRIASDLAALQPEYERVLAILAKADPPCRFCLSRLASFVAGNLTGGAVVALASR